MSVGTAHNVAIKHSWQLHIIDIIALPTDVTSIFLTLISFTEPMYMRSFARHYAPPSPEATGRCFAPCSFSAAYSMALTIFTYPVQRQRLPEIPTRISCSVGVGLRCSSATPAIIMPGVQYPHCKACS